MHSLHIVSQSQKSSESGTDTDRTSLRVAQLLVD